MSLSSINKAQALIMHKGCYRIMALPGINFNSRQACADSDQIDNTKRKKEILFFSRVHHVLTAAAAFAFTSPYPYRLSLPRVPRSVAVFASLFLMLPLVKDGFAARTNAAVPAT
jgi:hypothetical protein